MDELLVQAPQAHEHLTQIPAELQEPVSGSLLNLAHLALVRSQEDDYYSSYERVPLEEYDDEQRTHSNRVVTLVDETARLTRLAATELFETQPEATEQPGHNDILNRAKFIALDEAKRLHADGNFKGAEKALQNMLAIGLVQNPHTREQEEIREAVASGLEKQLLSAVQSMDGIVATTDTFTRPQDVPAMLAPSADLIRVATKTDFDANFQHPEHFFTSGNARQWREKLDGLDYVSLTALARNEKRYFPLSAAQLAVKSLQTLADRDKTRSCNSQEVCDTIVRAAEYVRDSGNSTLEDERQKAMAGIRERREAGLQPYRINSHVTYSLDDVVVTLARQGHDHEAQALLSSSPHEIQPPENGREERHYNLTSRINHTPDMSDEEKARLKQTIRELRDAKAENLRTSLIENGALPQVIENIIHSSSDPDSALDISKGFWEIYGNIRDKEAIRKMVEGTHTQELLATSATIQEIFKANVSLSYIDDHLVRQLDKVKGQPAKNEYLRQITELVQLAEEDYAQNYRFHRIESAIGTFGEFADPKQAFELAKKLYGDKAFDQAHAFRVIFGRDYGYNDSLAKIEPDIQEVIECVAANAANFSKITDPQFIREYLVPAGADKVKELISIVEASPGLRQLEVYASPSSMWRQLLDSDSISEKAQELEELFVSTGFKDLLESLDDTPRMQSELANSLFSYGSDTRAKAEQIVSLHNTMGFLREAGVNVNYAGHMDEWSAFFESMPQGAAGEVMKKQIIARLQLGIGEDPTQAIRIFTELNVDKNLVQSVRMSGVNLIRKLIAADSAKGFPSAKQNKIGEIFFDERLGELYQELYGLKVAGDMGGVAQFIQTYKLEPDHDITRDNLRDLIQELKQGTEEIHKDNRVAQFWLKEYSGQNIKASKLIEAWSARRLALRNGVKDNPTDILHFAAEHGLDIYAEDMFAKGQAHVTREEFAEQKDWLAPAVGSRYAPATIFRAIEHLVESKRAHNVYPEKILQPNRTTVTAGGAEYAAELLSGDDPRGFTIGFDTGCCMTLGGASESCIWAGYEDARYSFFAVYDNKKLRAQSVLYIAEADDQKILVVDNIEANAGTDLAPISEVYRAALSKFIKEQGLDIDAIHIGVGYTPAEIIQGLPDASSTPLTPRENTYTDAQGQQKVLWSR